MWTKRHDGRAEAGTLSLFTRWASTERSESTQIVALIPAALILLVLLPFVIAVACPRLDRQLHVDVFASGPVTLTLGGILVAVGMALGVWSNYMQFTLGRGTPLPMLPTHKLLTSGPYRYCRNPMTLGTLLAYLGISTAAASLTGTALVLLLGGLLIFYLKSVEERELAERFGDDYLHYLREVPFIIPRIPRRQ